MGGNERAATAATSSAEINLEKLIDAFAHTTNADVFQLAVYAIRFVHRHADPANSHKLILSIYLFCELKCERTQSIEYYRICTG